MVKNRIQWWVESNNSTPASQHGFRKRHSCADNLANLTLKVEEIFFGKKVVLAAFLGVKSAFVQIQLLLNVLATMGYPKCLLFFIKFLLFERQVNTESSGKQPILMYKGFPQYGVLSHLLYILSVGGIVKDMQKNIDVSQFADDIALYIKFKSLERARSILQNAIRKTQLNLEQLRLELLLRRKKPFT